MSLYKILLVNNISVNKLNNSTFINFLQKYKNSLGTDLISSLSNIVKDSSNNPDLRCLLIKASGPVFSSGHNLKDLAKNTSDEQHCTFSQCADLCLALNKLQIPVLCAVDGLAAAAGCQLVASCDIVLATKRSSFSTPGINFGLFCCGPGVAISRQVGQKAALKLLLTGEPISAEEAFRLGLVSFLTENDKLDADTEKVIKLLKNKSKSILALGKNFFYKQIEMNTEDAYRLAADTMTDNLKLKDGKEGLNSFAEKRQPAWNH